MREAEQITLAVFQVLCAEKASWRKLYNVVAPVNAALKVRHHVSSTGGEPFGSLHPTLSTGKCCKRTCCLFIQHQKVFENSLDLFFLLLVERRAAVCRTSCTSVQVKFCFFRPLILPADTDGLTDDKETQRQLDFELFHSLIHLKQQICQKIL